EFKQYLKSKGVHHEKTNAYTPQENGMSEQMNHTLVESARAMLSDHSLPTAGLPNKYWGDAILHVAHLQNHLPTRALEWHETLFKAYTGNKPSLSHLRIFRCEAHVHVPEEKHQKLDVKSLECTHLGFVENHKAYICLHQASERILKSQDVVFNEGGGG
ncbi:hypothetical protein PISMIDRAFT_115244, partial [Pisolithus microcarpus 441]